MKVRLADGRIVDRSLRQLSGGERQRVAVALQLAFADFAAERSGVHSDLIVLDEAFQVGPRARNTWRHVKCWIVEYGGPMRWLLSKQAKCEVLSVPTGLLERFEGSQTVPC